MPKKSGFSLQFPLGGIDRSRNYSAQPPYTARDLLNVRGKEISERRMSGGQRPGLGKLYPDQLGSGNPIKMLGQVSTVQDSALISIVDDFFRDGSTLGTGWSTPSWIGTELSVSTEYSGMVSEDTTGGGVHDAVDLDTSSAYWICLRIVPYAGEHRGTYSIFARMDDTTLAVTTDGISAELTIEGATGVYSGNLKVYASSVLTTYAFTGGTVGSAKPQWFRVHVNGNTITCYLDSTSLKAQAVSAAVGDRIGFGISATSAGDIAMVSNFQITGTPLTATEKQKRRTRLYAVANGQLYEESLPGVWTAVSGATVDSVNTLTCCEYQQKLYIADYSADGTGNVKVYDVKTGGWSTLTATDGTIPTGCQIICKYRDRIVLANGTLWYMSRQGDPARWDWSLLDASRPVSGQNTEASGIGEVITAMIPYGDDYMIIAHYNELYVLEGDPAFTGMLSKRSDEMGILDKQAWCKGPSGELYFMSAVGLGMMAPGSTSTPKPISDKLPQELQDIDTKRFETVLAWDSGEDGVHIFITPLAADAEASHWFYYPKTGGFFRDTYSSAYEPFCALFYDIDIPGYNRLVLGCRDGYVRCFDDANETDDGAAITSFAEYGPILPGGNIFQEGKILKVEATLGQNSGDVTWAAKVARTPEAIASASNFTSGAWSVHADGHGRQYSLRGLGRGGAFLMTVTSSGSRSWSVDSITGIKEALGAHKLGG